MSLMVLKVLDQVLLLMHLLLQFPCFLGLLQIFLHACRISLICEVTESETVNDGGDDVKANDDDELANDSDVCDDVTKHFSCEVNEISVEENESDFVWILANVVVVDVCQDLVICDAGGTSSLLLPPHHLQILDHPNHLLKHFALALFGYCSLRDDVSKCRKHNFVIRFHITKTLYTQS